MNMTRQYHLHRLLPFFTVYFLLEIIEVSLLTLTGSPAEWQDMRGITFFAGELLASFCFCIQPYLLYVAALPAAFHGGRADHLATKVMFALFCTINALEELGEVILGKDFELICTNFLQSPAESWQYLVQQPGLGAGLAVTAALVAAAYACFHRHLVPEPPAPSGPRRLLACLLTACAGFILLLAASSLEQQGEMSYVLSDGMIDFFGGVFAITTVPDLPLIFAPPCLGTLLLIGLAWGGNAWWERVAGPGNSPLAMVRRLHAVACARYGSMNIMLGALLLLVLGLRLASLPLYPLMDTTEARYAEMARKMVETGQWLQPQFDYGVPFWGKPPLSFWASAAGMKLFGINEFGARIAPYLCSLCIALCFMAWRFREQALPQRMAAALVFLTCGIGYVSAGAVMTDAYLALGTTLSMVAFWNTMQEGTRQRLWGYLFFTGLGIGLLSKGPLALVLCGLPLAAWATWQRRWLDTWQRLPWLGGSLLLAVLVLPWYAAAEHATPGFLRYFIIGEHIERFLVKGWTGDLYGSGHARATGTIWVYGATMFLPWVLMAPFLLRRGFSRCQTGRGELAYLLLWGLAPLVFFTPARNILPAYVLPGVPAWCLLFVKAVWYCGEQQPASRRLIMATTPLLAIVLLFMLGSGFSFIQYRCDRDLLAGIPGGKTVYYLMERPTYSASFYTAGKAQGYTGNPADLPCGSLLVTRSNQPPPAGEWTPKQNNLHNTLWVKH